MDQHDLLHWFEYGHLPEGEPRETSKRFRTLAVALDNSLPNCAEKTVALRKLLESKDCAVRAALAR